MQLQPPLRFQQPDGLSHGWEMLVSSPGYYATPQDIPAGATWSATYAPANASHVLKADPAFREAAANPHDLDIWYRCSFNSIPGARLLFEGLATIAEVWLDGKLAATSASMFQPFHVDLINSGKTGLVIAFRSLGAHLKNVKGKRARWRTSLVDQPALRLVRTSFLGHMPGWCPEASITGPYRTIKLQPAGAFGPDSFSVQSEWTKEGGCLHVSIKWPEGAVIPDDMAIECAGQRAHFTLEEGRLTASFTALNVMPWWPHTHGEPKLYDVILLMNGAAEKIAATGFRSVSIDKGNGESRFSFVINDQKIFARGVCWTPVHHTHEACSRAYYLRELALMREAGFNMVRVPGITVYEHQMFFDVADELGIMVWHDLQLANLDYPFSDKDFRAVIGKEIQTFLRATKHNPSLVAVCGGSEVMQQAAMLGLPHAIWNEPFFTEDLPQLVAQARNNIVCIPNSPFGGELPFHVNTGVAQYYGAGAYLRPLDDARRADVSFAAECLAFSNVPDNATLAHHHNFPPVHHPGWKAAVPRDRGASWDFEDVRDHYTTLLYGIDCALLRRENPQLYLAYARAAPAEVMEAVFAEWRRPASRTAGGLVFLWKDFVAGAGWGILDATGRPKSVWHALKRACQPVQIVFSDEGVNGLYIHVLNETATTLNAIVSIECLSANGSSVVSGRRQISVSPRQSASLTTTDIFGAFFDTNYAYRFGPPAHEIAVAELLDAASNDIISTAHFFPQGRGRTRRDNGLKAELIETDGAYSLALSCERYAQTVAIDDANMRPDENYFHLRPGRRKIVRLHQDSDSKEIPSGSISALNGIEIIQY